MFQQFIAAMTVILSSLHSLFTFLSRLNKKQEPGSRTTLSEAELAIHNVLFRTMVGYIRILNSRYLSALPIAFV